jgi:hypothetical protein
MSETVVRGHMTGDIVFCSYTSDRVDALFHKRENFISKKWFFSKNSLDHLALFELMPPNGSFVKYTTNWRFLELAGV